MADKKKHFQSKASRAKQLLDDLSTINKFKNIIEGDWPIKEGDKVRLNLEVIKKHPGYSQKLPTYRRFCEENADTVFTVEYDRKVHNGVVSLVEDTTSPKWLFWIGDLEKVSLK